MASVSTDDEIIDSMRDWSSWYFKQRWRKRSRHQLRVHPLCAMCEARGVVTAAYAADHVIPHKGNERMFWFGELQSLCASCHSSSKAQLETKGYVNDIGGNGWPVDPRHPVYRKEKVRSQHDGGGSGSTEES